VEVSRGDSLWSIAEVHLGDGERWTEIAALNEGRTMADGRTFLSRQAIHPGWNLVVPDKKAASAGLAESTYVVQPGDTLSDIADDQAGDASLWPELFERSRRLDQPVPLTDPDLILPGQVIAVPGSQSVPSKTEAEVTDEIVKHVEEVADGVTTSPRAVDGPIASRVDSDTPVSRASAQVSSGEEEHDIFPSWVMPGLLGTGGLVAGSMWISLRNRRALQHRMRRPGRTITVGGANLVDVEKSVALAGAVSAHVVTLVDGVLKNVAQTLVNDGRTLPDLAAVEVTPTAIAVHLRSPAADPPPPWTTSDDQLVWIVDRTEGADLPKSVAANTPASWPLLVTVGLDDEEHTWLLNLEDLAVSVTGDSEAAEDFARSVAAQIACNPWSAYTTLDLVGVADEIVVMRSDRIRSHASASAVAADAALDVVRNVDRLDDYELDSATARAQQSDPDPWLARMLVVDQTDNAAAVDTLTKMIVDHPGRSSVTVLVTGLFTAGSLELTIDAHRRMNVPSVNLSVAAVGLSADEARGYASLLKQADVVEDRPVPDLADGEGWRGLATVTGSLRDEYTVDRHVSTLEPAASALPAPDELYVATAATTVEDLEALAPKVTDSVRAEVADADPTLDADLEDWYSESCFRPRLTLLGPVGARTRGKALDRRKPFYTELFAYLATRPFGATTDEVATAFNLTTARVRIDINKLRDWLGADPVTGAKYLPDARLAPSTVRRGMGVYEVVDVLIDWDLFCRLRLRGESRGADGIEDLRKALLLVSGRPFQKLRSVGWSWLYEGDRLDLHSIIAITDVAHLVVTHSLQDANLREAEWASELALEVAVDEEIPRLDFAAVLRAQGHEAQAFRYLADNVSNRDDGDEDLSEMSNRAERITGWTDRQQRVAQ
jgi:LysM repeat protein